MLPFTSEKANRHIAGDSVFGFTFFALVSTATGIDGPALGKMSALWTRNFKIPRSNDGGRRQVLGRLRQIDVHLLLKWDLYT